MKRFSAIFSSLALAGAIVLFAACSGDKKTGTKTTDATQTSADPGSSSGRIAWVNIDTLNEHYQVLKAKKAEFIKKSEAVRAQIDDATRKFQAEYNDFAKKLQSGGYTSEEEAKKANNRLASMEQTIKKQEQTLTENLMKEQEIFNKELKRRLNIFLDEYIAEKKYDYILTYSDEVSQIMYKNKSLDVTWDVINGMNKTQGTPIETTEKK